MVKRSGLLRQLQPAHILVVGDVMLDTYTTGSVKRISPEAPVSVLHAQKEENLPGGAGNVALNLLSLGASVCIMGRVGGDRAGGQLRELLIQEGVDTAALRTQEGFRTPVKNRFIADSQQILRVDFEQVIPLDPALEEDLLRGLPTYLSCVQTVAISDYAKGFLSTRLLTAIIEQAAALNIPVIVDPKGDDFAKYAGAQIVKPNVAEAYCAAKEPLQTPLEVVAERLLERYRMHMLMVTRSEAGISLFRLGQEALHFPVCAREVKDVTGAGDTVLAMVSIALANQIDVGCGVELANIAAAMAVERLGCARITLSEVAERVLSLDAGNKIFDEEQLFALQQALQDKRCIVLVLESAQGMTTALFRALRKLRSLDKECKLIVYVQEPDEEFASFLASLEEVDFIVLRGDSLRGLCDVLPAHRLFLLAGEELMPLEHAVALP